MMMMMIKWWWWLTRQTSPQLVRQSSNELVRFHSEHPQIKPGLQLSFLKLVRSPNGCEALGKCQKGPASKPYLCYWPHWDLKCRDERKTFFKQSVEYFVCKNCSPNFIHCPEVSSCPILCGNSWTLDWNTAWPFHHSKCLKVCNIQWIHFYCLDSYVFS